jgi:hypothetical protein
MQHRACRSGKAPARRFHAERMEIDHDRKSGKNQSGCEDEVNAEKHKT